jgi:hypothetical protein
LDPPVTSKRRPAWPVERAVASKHGDAAVHTAGEVHAEPPAGLRLTWSVAGGANTASGRL